MLTCTSVTSLLSVTSLGALIWRDPCPHLHLPGLLPSPAQPSALGHPMCSQTALMLSLLCPGTRTVPGVEPNKHLGSSSSCSDSSVKAAAQAPPCPVLPRHPGRPLPLPEPTWPSPTYRTAILCVSYDGIWSSSCTDRSKDWSHRSPPESYTGCPLPLALPSQPPLDACPGQALPTLADYHRLPSGAEGSSHHHPEPGIPLCPHRPQGPVQGREGMPTSLGKRIGLLDSSPKKGEW